MIAACLLWSDNCRQQPKDVALREGCLWARSTAFSDAMQPVLDVGVIEDGTCLSSDCSHVCDGRILLCMYLALQELKQGARVITVLYICICTTNTLQYSSRTAAHTPIRRHPEACWRWPLARSAFECTVAARDYKKRLNVALSSEEVIMTGGLDV